VITVDELTRQKEQVDALRPLTPKEVGLLWPHWRSEDALFVYATNAIEGSTFTLGETTVVLESGITIGGKPLQDHLDVINGAKAYALMLQPARLRADSHRPARKGEILRYSQVAPKLRFQESETRNRFSPLCGHSNSGPSRGI